MQIFSGYKPGAKLIEKIIHMLRRWGTPQNFFLIFVDELKKQIIIKKSS